MVGGERDRPLRRWLDPVLVQEAHRPHGVVLRRRHHAVGRVERRLAEAVPPGGAAPKRWNWPCASARKTTTQSAMPHGDRRRGIAHGGRAAAATAAPVHVGEAQRRQAERRGQPRRVVAVVGVGGEAVDPARIDAGVLAGGEDRLQRQLELRDRRLAVPSVGGLADARDRHLAAQGAVAHGR